MTLQLLGECVEGLERRPRGEGQTFMQVGKMEVGAVVEDRSEAGEPDGATKIAGQIEEAEAFFTRSGGSVRHVIDWDHRRHQPDATEDLRPDELPEVPVAGEIGQDQALERFFSLSI